MTEPRVNADPAIAATIRPRPQACWMPWAVGSGGVFMDLGCGAGDYALDAAHGSDHAGPCWPWTPGTLS
jgi:hypothetical protein